ncbi:MAG: phosphoglucosamine mutase [Phycisphaerae bacterium]|nr:phosphoglucosamine mutase [Phycisphaerae bacterium]
MTLMMTVSGVRGIVGQTMTPTLAAELGAAFGSHLGGGTVVVGRDSRPSGPMVHSALAAGLLATGCNVVDLGIVSTPGVAVMIRHREAAGGVVITASHNPAEWNGIKFLTAQSFAPPPEEAAKILGRYQDKSFVLVDVHHVGRVERDDSTHERHVARVMSVLDVKAIHNKRFTVVLDSVNGAGGLGGHLLLEKLGCQVIHINAEPTGRFAHAPEPIRENLTGLCDAVRQHHANLGFAQDPDADRLAIVDDLGRYIGEEYTVALAAKFMFARRHGPAAVNLSTSRMIDDLAAQAGGDCVVHRTPVGEANVARAVLEYGCVIGGEGNGGVIDPRISAVRDSLVGMGFVLNLLADDGRPLFALVDEVPGYVMLKRKFQLDRDKIDAWLRRVPEVVGDGRLNDADGLRIDWPDGWVHLRPSNTEPIARVIAEAADSATAQALVKRVTDLL